MRAAGLIRDSEAENLIRDYSRPIFQAAGLTAQNIQIHLLNSRSFNAFVVDGQNMFIHVGAIMNAKTPNQIIGVIAHETGHIAGGHLARLRAHASKAQTLDLMLKILGLGLAVVGGASGGGGNVGKVGQAIAGGSSYATQRSINVYRQTEEFAADQAGLTYLHRTKQSGRGMLETFEYFANQSLGSLKYVDPYLLSHPLPRARISQLRTLARRSPYFTHNDKPVLQLRHQMVRAKLEAFLTNPQSVFNRYPRSDQTLPARYARAIASYRQSGVKSFLPAINALIKEHPKNPYFYEIKGQFLFETGHASAAIPPLRQSIALAPREGLIRIMLAQALLSLSNKTNNKATINEAINHLRKALVKEKRSALGYRLLANAYGKRREIASAELASAHAYFYEGKLKLAKLQAKRAKKKFKRGSPNWIKADDIIQFNPQ